MNLPILIVIEVAFAGLLAAATTRFNLQVVGANLPNCNQQELATTVKQTTGFALVAGALSLQAGDNIAQCAVHSMQTSLWVTAIMSFVLLWQSLPTITASACDAIDSAAEKVAEKGTLAAKSAKTHLFTAVEKRGQLKVEAISAGKVIVKRLHQLRKNILGKFQNSEQFIEVATPETSEEVTTADTVESSQSTVVLPPPTVSGVRATQPQLVDTTGIKGGPDTSRKCSIKISTKAPEFEK